MDHWNILEHSRSATVKQINILQTWTRTVNPPSASNLFENFITWLTCARPDWAWDHHCATRADECFKTIKTWTRRCVELLVWNTCAHHDHYIGMMRPGRCQRHNTIGKVRHNLCKVAILAHQKAFWYTSNAKQPRTWSTGIFNESEAGWRHILEARITHNRFHSQSLQTFIS